MNPELQLDYSTIRLPYEYAVKQFKNQRRSLESQIAQIMKEILNLQQDPENCTTEIEGLIAKLKHLKQKINESYQEMERSYAQIRKRITSLNEDSCSHDTKLNRGIIDWLMRTGHFKSAYKMMKLHSLEVVKLVLFKDFCEMEFQLVKEAYLILQDLKQKSTHEAMKWCAANRSRLQKIGSSFEFHLIMQEYIELLRINKVNEGLSKLRRAVSTMSRKPPFLFQNLLEKAMGCLMFLKNREQSQYAYYFAAERWDDLVLMFKVEMQNVYSLDVVSQFDVTLQVGMSTMKTIYCQTKDYQKPSVCPLCNKILQPMISQIPSTQQSQSTWICRITGEIMDENNPPMMLPNYQVYSLKALQKLAGKSNGRVICPFSKDEYSITEATKIYLS